MITATNYSIEYDNDRKIYKIHNEKPPYCPVCGLLLSGYDTRRRHVIDGGGVIHWFALRRLRCPNCKKLHLEMPDFIKYKKHYDVKTITTAIESRLNDCPADDSTIRRWRQENHPPGLPV
jgi:hypothetical protein